MQYIAFDSHKRYTWACVESEKGKVIQEAKITHERGALRQFLSHWEPGSPVAVETIGNWYWIVDEIEAAGMKPRLVHARKAKLMMGAINKTDKLDARGLNQLQRAGTLPTTWIPPAKLRDVRELLRTRMVLVAQRTRLKNRIHATLAKYALTVTGVSDIFGKKGRVVLAEQLKQLPVYSRFATEQLLAQLDFITIQIKALEDQLWTTLTPMSFFEQIHDLPGVGMLLAAVILLEVGDISRFPSASHFASYAGTVPRVHASGGKVRYGRTRQDANRYLKWAYVEAANTICSHRHRANWKDRHVCRLYRRVVARRGHQIAIGAVARHLAEASYWMLMKGELYQEPQGFVHRGASAE